MVHVLKWKIHTSSLEPGSAGTILQCYELTKADNAQNILTAQHEGTGESIKLDF